MRFEVENIDGIRDVTPLLGKNNIITYTREDKRMYDFKKELKEISFTGADYRYFAAIEAGLDRCKLHTIRLYNECGALEDDLKFTGTFSSSDGSWDLDRCTVKFKIKLLDPYSCFEDNDNDINLLGIGLATSTVQMGISIQLDVYYSPNHEYYEDRLICPCDYEPSSEWILDKACDGFTKEYTKRHNEVGPINGNSYTFLRFDFTAVNEIDNGLDLKDVLQALLDRSCSYNLTITSDFFQWNTPFRTDINYVTQIFNKYTNIKIFQKSDVKRPNTKNNATKAETNFKDLLEAICKIFNLGYKITDREFRLEHISWFEKELGMDLTRSSENKFLLKGTRKYIYDSSKLPKTEKFAMMESLSADFVGADIIYDSNCVNDDDENKSENTIDFITTDVSYVVENYESDSGAVSDDGFVLMACDENNVILREQGILEDNTSINNVLSWAHLHRDLWKHGRVLPQGNMNNNLTTFKSIIPTIKQDKFTAILNCQQIRNFDPVDQIKGTLGWGFIQTAELSLNECTLQVQMHLEEIDIAPVIDENFGDFDKDFDSDFD